MLNALSEKIPEEQGMERVSPNVPQAVVALAQLGQLVKIRRGLEADALAQLTELIKIRRVLENEQFGGNVREVILTCTDHRQQLKSDDYPFLPEFITVVFFNDGPNTAYISLNDTNLPFTIRLSESHPIDLTQAKQRIQTLYYWCATGNTASVRLQAKY
jgi:hypothetical protein